ncbi:MAG: glycoside hydrolase, partial [Spirosoma sp.]|nr:glycoside hydrolase [Spirosoma sp.]
VERWLLPQPFGRLCEQLGEQGYAFDYVSDALLSSLTASRQGVRSPGGATYQVILVPRTTYIPETSLRQLAKLAQQGVRIIFDGQLPQQAAGFYNHQTRSADVQQLGKTLQKLPSVVVSTDVFETMKRLGIRVESWASEGLSFMRKRQRNGHSADTIQYFITNLGNRFHQNWLTLSATGQVIRYNPLTNQQDPLPVRKGKNGHNDVFLQLEPGESCFINVHSGTPSYTDAAEQQRLASPSTKTAIPLQNPWQVQFVEGRPALSISATMQKLVSWTTLSDSAGYFSGTVRYTTNFDLPDGITASTYVLNLGDVREVAYVQLNGQPLGTAWCIPFQLSIPANRLKPRDNQLAVSVTNLSANYMRLYDRQNPGWKKFYDINIVDIRYKPFDATTWDALPSGLLGPVTLTPRGR